MLRTIGRAGGTVLVMSCLLFAGCFATRHTVGNGPHGGEVRVHHTWYAAWGFLPLGALDSRDVVGAADDYRVSVGFGAVDVLINIFTAPIGFYRHTTQVEK